MNRKKTDLIHLSKRCLTKSSEVPASANGILYYIEQTGVIKIVAG
jgi:hypothetical protein